jgi:hypothetical protein
MEICGFDTWWDLLDCLIGLIFRPQYVFGVTQTVTEMITRSIFSGGGVKAAGVEGWQPYNIPVPIVFILYGGISGRIWAG